MRNLIIFSLIVIVLFALSSCSKKTESKLVAFSPEAFAYDMGDSSEVDATVRVKGFEQNQENGFYKATLSYDLDLVTPKGDTLKSMISRVVDKSAKEKISDTPLDAQFDLDSTYVKGKYKLLFRIKDANSGQTAESSANFTIGE